MNIPFILVLNPSVLQYFQHIDVQRLSLIVLPVRSSGFQQVTPPPLSLSTSGWRNQTDLRWITPNQTVPHRPVPPSWASNGSPGHPDTSPPLRHGRQVGLHSSWEAAGLTPPSFLSPVPALWERGGQMCPDEHVLICAPGLMRRQRPPRINSFISLKRRRGENELTGRF